MAETDNSYFNYLPVPDRLSRLGFYVTGAGTSTVPPNSQYPTQQHPELYDFKWGAGRILPEYQFVFISEGQGEFETQENGLQPVEPGTVLILIPDVWHRYRPIRSVGWTEHWISIGGDLLFQWHQRELFESASPLPIVQHSDTILKLFHEVIDLLVDNPDKYQPRQTALAMETVMCCFDEIRQRETRTVEHSQKADSYNPIVTNALKIIWNHSHQRISIDMIAKKIGANRRTLERHFRDQVGRTVLQELVSCRLQRACRLLKETHVTIKYAAYAAGFSSLSGMCKVFRRELGCTPGDFRLRAVEGRGKRQAAKNVRSPGEFSKTIPV